MPRLFFPQEWVDEANLEEIVRVEGDSLTVPADGKVFRLTPAVRFLKVDGGDDDPNGWVGKVKPAAELEGLGAEAMEKSVIHGDTAYGVQPGYIAEYQGQGSPISSVFR
jgi:hypothetical protein